jgi:cytochrome c oxidase subunit II
MSARVRLRAAWCIPITCLLASCNGIQTALDPAGSGADIIHRIWLLLFWVCAAVWVLVLLALLWAILRRRGIHDPATAPEPEPDPRTERRIGNVVGIAIAATVIVLIGLTVVSYSAGRGLFSENGDGAVSIELVGHQWWWEVKYLAAEPSQSFVGANEIHLPVGETVRIILRADDVIHSLWVPNLNGKKDLIPGQTNVLYMSADRPGTFRGQCAEFCGLQHAHMALFVVAEPKENFAAWEEKQRRPAQQPRNAEERRGQQVFLEGPCVMCHTIQGTIAGATTGPDLTHLASRLSIGAGRVPNTRGHLGGWILDPQTLKPGNQMPPNPLPPTDFQALLSYLDSLE